MLRLTKSLFVAILILLSVLTGCFNAQNNSVPEDAGSSMATTGIADLTGGNAYLPDSWEYINQTYQRKNDWKRIVTDSEFTLGDINRIYNHRLTTDKGVEVLEAYEQEYGAFPYMDGSTVATYMGLEFARQHLGLSDEMSKKFASFRTTHSAYENLITKYIERDVAIYQSPPEIYLETKPVDLIIVTEPSDSELALAKENGVALSIKPVCYDAFVFIANKNNPINSLTIQQVQDIYSGKIQNWKQLGGLDEPIIAYQREENSGSQTTMQNLVMKDIPLIKAPTALVNWSMKGLIEVVAEYENGVGSIGYTFLFYIDALYKNDNIKIVKIDGVEPTPEAIRTSQYPFATNYFGVIRSEDEFAVGGKFLDWMLTPEGQKCIEQAGYIPL
jgi:phosphate transport system substrate-binding protein